MHCVISPVREIALLLQRNPSSRASGGELVSLDEYDAAEAELTGRVVSFLHEAGGAPVRAIVAVLLAAFSIIHVVSFWCSVLRWGVTGLAVLAGGLVRVPARPGNRARTGDRLVASTI